MIWQRVATIVICLSTLVLVAAFEADHDNEEWQASVFSHQDTVGAGNYSRFVLKHEGPLRIILHSIEGDADLYVSFRNETVSFELDKHDASSVTCGLDFVDIPSSPRPAYLGVYGHPSREFSEWRLLIVAVNNATGTFPLVPEHILDWDHVLELSRQPSDHEHYSALGTVLVELVEIFLTVLFNL